MPRVTADATAHEAITREVGLWCQICLYFIFILQLRETIQQHARDARHAMYRICAYIGAYRRYAAPLAGHSPLFYYFSIRCLRRHFAFDIPMNIASHSNYFSNSAFNVMLQIRRARSFIIGLYNTQLMPQKLKLFSSTWLKLVIDRLRYLQEPHDIDARIVESQPLPLLSLPFLFPDD